uniref:Ubiquitin-like protease family profile domain-containing protein n=1 Tax=Brassica oleracea var. oleracea TaxID=109376 RepID=A0A0D3BWW3_BRAOL
MLGFQLDIKKKYELWSLVGPELVRFSLLEFGNLTGLNCEYIEDLERPHSVVTKELTSYWEILGVHVEAGPSTQEIIAALERCEGWSWDDRKRLACLAIFTGYIEGRKVINFVQRTLSESVNGTNAGRKSLAEDKGPDVPAAVPADASSSKDKAPEPSLVLLDKNQPTVSDLQKKNARYQEKRGMLLWHFTVQRVIEQGNLLPHSNLHIDAWINVLRKRYDANPQHFRSERMCYLDHIFAQQWRFNFKDFKDSEPGQNGLGRRLPGGVELRRHSLIAMWISIPKWHIVVFDSICSSISPEELDVVMEPFLYMVPYLLVEGTSSDEQRAQYSLEPFTYERPTNIPLARSGDCGVYTLKYIECHALGIEFSKTDFAKASGKSMRDKMAVDIFQELPDAHEFENKEMDDNLGVYDE